MFVKKKKDIVSLRGAGLSAFWGCENLMPQWWVTRFVYVRYLYIMVIFAL